MNLARVPSRRGVATLAAALLCSLVAACGTSSPSSAPRATSIGAATATGTPIPPASFGPPPSPTEPDDTTPLVVDPTLLALLPDAIDGIKVTEDADAAAQALGDQGLPAIATALDAAVAVDLGNSDLVYALVVRVRPAAFGNSAFRQWRDSYDEGACAANGVAGNAEATLGGRQTFITSCAGGMHTYHVYLGDLNVVISASSIGDGRFGEKLLDGLRVPDASGAPS